MVCLPDELEARYNEKSEKLEQMQKLAVELQVQLADAQCDAADMRAVRDRLVKEFDEERQALQDALDGAIIDRAEIEVHWQREYEQLRTLNSGKRANQCHATIILIESSRPIKCSCPFMCRSRGAFDAGLRMENSKN